MLDDWLAVRRGTAGRLRAGLADIPGIGVSEVSGDAQPAWFRVYACVQSEGLAAAWSRDRIIRGPPGTLTGAGDCRAAAGFHASAWVPVWWS